MIVNGQQPGARNEQTTNNQQPTNALGQTGPTTPTPLLVGRELYIINDTGKLSCLDAITGKIIWQDRIRGHFSASPVCANGLIFATSEKGIVTVFKAGKKFEIIGQNDMEEKTYATPAIVDDALIIRTESMLYRIEKQ